MFIDGNNLYMGLKQCFRIERLNLEPFCRYIVRERELCAIYYADANFLQELGKENYARQQSYFSYVRRIENLIFRQGYYSSWTTPPTEKRTDVHLATDLVDLCHRDCFDVAYLISGDADLTPAVDIVLREGKHVINVYLDKPNRNSRAIRKSHQVDFIEITRSVAQQFMWDITTSNKTPVPFGTGDPGSK